MRVQVTTMRFQSFVRSVLCVVIVVCLSGAAPLAATYYVATSGGSDGRSCALAQTIGTPKASISDGIGCLSAGDTLLVRGGTYNETIFNPSIAGTSWSNKVRIAAYPGETVWLHPTGNPARYALHLFGVQRYVEFDGINVDGTDTQYGAVKIEGYDVAAGNPHHIRIQNAEMMTDESSLNVPGTGTNIILVTAQTSGIVGFNEFINLTLHRAMGYGIYTSSGDNLIERCNIYDVGGIGIHISNSYGSFGNNNVIRNNVIHDITHSVDGRITALINGSGNPSNTLFYNNLIYGLSGATQWSGIYLYTGTNVGVYNNTIYGGAGPGVIVSQAVVSGAIIRGNIAYNNTGAPYYDYGTGTVADHNLFGPDPQFVSPGSLNFQLKATSPARNTGMSIGAVTTDITGSARPKEGTADIGAYEYGGGGPSPPSAPTGLRVVPE